MAEMLVEGDKKPSLYFAVVDETGTAVNLTGCTVNFYFVNEDVLGTIVNSGHTTCTVYDAAGGLCRYDWGTDDLDEPGDYLGELEVTYADTSTQTVYEVFRFNVRQDFGPTEA